MPLKMLIAADDFTGALDTAVQFSAKGANVRMTYGDWRAAFSEETEVLSVDLETRHCTPDTARERARSLFSFARERKIPYLYKKMDSAMRGNPGAELAALSEVYEGAPVMVVPAFPKIGRTVRDGVLRIAGVPVAKSAFAHDPLNPVSRSDLCGLLAEQGALGAVSVRAEQFCAETAQRAPFWIFDGETGEALQKTGALLARAGLLKLTAGNAGFGEILAAQIPWVSYQAPIFRRSGGILLICGSLHPRSAEQAAYAEQKLGFYSGAIPADLAALQNCWETEAGMRTQTELFHALQDGENAVVRTAGCKGAVSMQTAQTVSANLGTLCRKLIRTGAVGTLVVFGGDTLLGVMEALGCKELQPVCEVCPGVVASHLETGFDGAVISKAGSFGTPDLPETILWFLAAQPS